MYKPQAVRRVKIPKMQRLSKLVGNMKDEDDRVTIPGFYGAVTIDAGTRKAPDAIPFDEAAFNRRIGIARRERIGRSKSG
jgi:hypothetical protein